MLLSTTRDKSSEKRWGERKKKKARKKGIGGAKHLTVLGILLTPWHVPSLRMFLWDPTGHIRNKGM